MSKVRTVKPVEERREEIISAARRLFLTNGYKNTSVSNIATELGIAQGLIFHYFKTKAALLYTIFDIIAAEQEQKTRQFFESYQGRVIDCMGAVFQMVQQTHGYEVLFADLTADPAVLEYLQDKLVHHVVPVVIDLIGRGNADGSWQCDYPQQTAVFMVHGLSGLLKSKTDYDAELLRQAIQSIVYRTLNINQ